MLHKRLTRILITLFVYGCLFMIVTFAVMRPIKASTHDYPLQSDDDCGTGGKTCQQVIDEWNQASWADIVTDTFDSSNPNVAAVRWYASEWDYVLKSDDDCLNVDQSNNKFCGVTDEFSNVLLSHSMGSQAEQTAYEKLHNFSELLRHPDSNGLQCWKYYINGNDAYTFTNYWSTT